MRWIAWAFAFSVVLGLPEPSTAKICKKGCACGGSCIPCSHRCRLNETPSLPPVRPVLKVPARHSTRPSGRVVVTESVRRHGAKADPVKAEPVWGAELSKLYFTERCIASHGFDREKLVELESEAAAREAGFALAPHCLVDAPPP